MAIKRGDIYEHNNPVLPIVDSKMVCGGGRSVASLSALYALNDRPEQLAINVTRVWVVDQSKFYILIDLAHIGDITGWKVDTVELTTSLTYAQVKTLRDTSKLAVGQKYIINNYKTSGSAVVEPIVLEALAVNKLATECKSTLYPQDIIHYDIDDASIGYNFGKIFRRIDTIQNNDICTDWRHLTYTRWKIAVTAVWTIGNDYTVGAIVKDATDIYICVKTHTVSTLGSNWHKLPFINGAFVGLAYDGYPVYVDGTLYKVPVSTETEIAPMFRTYSATVYNNTIKSQVLPNIVFIGSSFHDIFIDSGNTDLTFNGNSDYIKLGINNTKLIFGGTNTSINIGIANTNSIIGNNNQNIMLGSSCDKVLIGNDITNFEIKNNVIGSGKIFANIATDYSKVVKNQGNVVILSYTDEYGDINILDL